MTTTPRAAAAGRLVVSLMLLTSAAVVAGLATRSLVRLAVDADLFDLAAAIESGASPDAAYLARFVRRAGLDQASADCDDSFTRASLTVTWAALEAATAADDARLTEDAERNARRAAARRLACNPLDGNAWLRYAMIETRGGGPTASAIEALSASYRTAPSEGWIIEPRLAFATDLRLAGATGFEAEYSADLRRFASFEPTSRVAAAYVATLPPVRAELRQPIDAQPAARKRAIIAEIDRLGVDYGRDAP